MRRFPLLFALAALPVACGGTDEGPPEPAADDATEAIETIPFVDRSVAESFVLVSGAGDTLRFAAVPAGDGGIRLSRTLRRPAGIDSVAALIDARTKEPIASYQRRFTERGDSLVARVDYGAGFEGQARLELVVPQGRAVENLRTPSPVLDAAQVPQTLSALDLSTPDTISFNYVAPFEQRAVAAQVEIGRLDTLDVGGVATAAYPVTVLVGGLEERAWLAAPPGDYRLLRWEESTRRVTWTRPAE